jgi:putative membrane protein
VILRFLFSAVGLLVASTLVPGIHHGPFVDLLAVAVILGFLNATLGMLLKFIAFLPMACSFGCLSLFINGLVFWAASWVALRMGLAFRVSGFWAGVFGALVSSIVATVLESLFLGREQPPRPEAPRRIKIVS